MLYRFAGFQVDTVNYALFQGQEKISIEPKVFDLLVFLIERRDQLVTRAEIFEVVWQGREVSDTSLSNHIKSIRKILGDDVQQQDIIRTTRGRGYQFIAPVEEAGETMRVLPRPSLRQGTVYRAVIVLLVCLVGFLVYRQATHPPGMLMSGAGNHKLIAVLPLHNMQPDPDTDFLGFALADQIIGHLSYARHISVRPSASIRQFEQNSGDPVRIGQDLKVDYVLSGSYLKQDNLIRLNLELIKVADNDLIWRAPVALSYDTVFELQDKVAQAMAQKNLLGLVRGERRALKDITPVDPVAYDFYLRSLSAPLTDTGDKQALVLLEKALLHAAEYAPIHAEMGFRLQRRATFGLAGTTYSQRAETHLRQALERDPLLLDAYRNLATLYTETGQGIKGMRSIRHMLAINPNHADAYFSLGYLYRYAGLLDQSIDMMEKARWLDPANPKYRGIGASYYSAGHYEKAIAVYDQGHADAHALAFQGSVFLRIGEKEKALENFRRIIELEAGDFWRLDALANMAIISGDHAAGLKAVLQLEDSQTNDAEALYYWASYYAALGERDGALRLLKDAVQRGYFNVPFMKTDPFFKTLRSSPEYGNIIQQAEHKQKAFMAAVADDL